MPFQGEWTDREENMKQRKYLKFVSTLSRDSEQTSDRKLRWEMTLKISMKFNIFHLFFCLKAKIKCLILINELHDVPIVNLTKQMCWNYRKHQYFSSFCCYIFLTSWWDIETMEIMNKLNLTGGGLFESCVIDDVKDSIRYVHERKVWKDHDKP